MSIKRLSLRFNLEKEDERKAWEYLQKQPDSKNQTIIKAINDMANPQASITQVIETTIRDCLNGLSVMQSPETKEVPVLSDDENQLLDTLEDFLGG